MENEDINVDEIVEEVIEADEEPVIIKKRRPHFSEADMARRKKQANSPENIERLKAMREKASKIAEEKRKKKVMEQAKEFGMIPPVPVAEPPKPVVEPPKPVVEAPKPIVEPPKPVVEAPIVEKKEEPKKKARRIPKPKKKKQVEYIEDEEEEEEPYVPPRPLTRQKQMTQRDVDDFIRNKYATMDLRELEQRMAKQAYDFKYQKYKEEVMGNQIFGRY